MYYHVGTIVYCCWCIMVRDPIVYNNIILRELYSRGTVLVRTVMPSPKKKNPKLFCRYSITVVSQFITFRVAQINHEVVFTATLPYCNDKDK